MIKILNIIDSLGTGGTERVLINTISNTMDKVEHTVMIKNDEVNVYQDFINNHNIEVVKAPKASSVIQHYIYVKRYINENSNNIDIIHYYGGSMNYYTPIYIANRLNIPIIIHSHNSQSNNPKLSSVHKSIKKIHNKIGQSYNIGCSYEAGKWMFEDDDFEVLINGIDIDKYRDGYHVGKEKRGELFSQDSIVMGNFGRFNRQKNQKYLLHLLADLHTKGHSQYRLLLIGEGELESELREQIKMLDLEEFVEILGFQSNLEEYYGRIDVFVMSSLFEGLPLVLIEAQAAGVPVLVADTVDEKININSNLKFFNLQDSYSNIEKTLFEVVNIGHQPSSLYGTDYDLTVMSEKMYDIYESVVNQNN